MLNKVTTYLILIAGLVACSLNAHADYYKYPITVGLAGYLNQAAFAVDDGDHTTWFVGNNDNDDTTLRIVVLNEMLAPINMAAIYQASIKNLSSDNVSNTGGGTRNIILTYIADYAFLTDKWGMLHIGHGNAASDNSAEVDLTATVTAQYSETFDNNASFLFRKPDGTLEYDFLVGDAFSNLDGLDRQNRIRYDTPTYKGLTLAGSYIQGSRHDVALTFEKDFDYVQFGAAAAYARATDGDDEIGQKIIDGSFSALTKIGLSVTAAAGKLYPQEDDPVNANTYYLKLGYQVDFGPGFTGVSVDTGRYRHFVSKESLGKTYGIAIAQHIDKWNTQFYAAWRVHKQVANDIRYKNMYTMFVGLRISFMHGDIKYT